MNSNADSIVELVTSIEKEMSTRHRPARLRELRKRFSKLLESQYGSTVVRIAISLVRNRAPDGRFMAYELIAHHPHAPMAVGSKELFRLGADLNSPEAADMFATYLVGPAWREGRINDDLITYWAKRPERYWRRAALMSTIALNTAEVGGHGDRERTLMVCRLLVDDHDNVVVRGMIQALLELSKRDPLGPAIFVEQNRQRLAQPIVRELSKTYVTDREGPIKKRRRRRK